MCKETNTQQRKYEERSKEGRKKLRQEVTLINKIYIVPKSTYQSRGITAPEPIWGHDKNCMCTGRLQVDFYCHTCINLLASENKTIIFIRVPLCLLLSNCIQNKSSKRQIPTICSAQQHLHNDITQLSNCLRFRQT